MIHISPGNTKIGRVANLSCLPGVDCVADAPCRTSCYAKRFMHCFKTTERNWTENSADLNRDPLGSFEQVARWLGDHPEYTLFRYWVGGDFPSQAVVDASIDLAREFPGIRFMAFTKRHDLVIPHPGENYNIIRSTWPGWEVDYGDADNFAYVVNRQVSIFDAPVPASARMCTGNCTECGHYCWYMKPGESVWFHRH